MKNRVNLGGGGLVFTIDLIASLLFFLVIILTVLWLWGETHSQVNEYMETDARQSRLLEISTMLVKTQGNPRNWETQDLIDADNVNALGLAGESNVLEESKLDAFVDAEYGELRKMLGLGSEDFNFSVIEDWGGTPIIRYSVGKVVDTGEVRVLSRYALLNGTRVLVKLEAYYDRK